MLLRTTCHPYKICLRFRKKSKSVYEFGVCSCQPNITRVNIIKFQCKSDILMIFLYHI